MEFIDYADSDMLMLSLARELSRDLRDALGRKERVLFAVPGGTSPGPVFDLLAASDLDWDRIDVIPGDERWVPMDHPRSNAGQIRAHLLQGLAAKAHLVSLYRDGQTAEDAVDGINADVAPLLPVDVALVGMGADMHTASLFPGAPQLAQALADDAPAVMAITAPGADEPRVTLTAQALKAAYALHVLIIGDAKQAALNRAQKLPEMQAPIAAILDQARVHWAP